MDNVDNMENMDNGIWISYGEYGWWCLVSMFMKGRDSFGIHFSPDEQYVC